MHRAKVSVVSAVCLDRNPFPLNRANGSSGSIAMLELQLFVASFFLRFQPTLSERLKPADMEMTDGFSGGPAAQSLPLYLHERHKIA